MNYLISILIALILILGIAFKFQYDEKKEYQNALNVTIDGYESSIINLESKSKFELEMMQSKEKNIRSSERVKIEKERRGQINENINNCDDFIIVNF